MILATDITPTDLTMCIMASRCIKLLPADIDNQRLFLSHATAAWSLDRDALAPPQARAELSRHLLEGTVMPGNERFSRCAVRPSRQAPGPARAPVGQQRDFAVGQHFDFADNPVAAAKFAISATVRT